MSNWPVWWCYYHPYHPKGDCHICKGSKLSDECPDCYGVGVLADELCPLCRGRTDGRNV